MLHQNDSPPTFPPTVDWPWRSKASDGSISVHHQDVIDEGSASGRSISKTHEKEIFRDGADFVLERSDKVHLGQVNASPRRKGANNMPLGRAWEDLGLSQPADSKCS